MAKEKLKDLRDKIPHGDVTKVQDYDRDKEDCTFPPQELLKDGEKPVGAVVVPEPVVVGARGFDDMDEALVLGRLEQVAAAANRKDPFSQNEPADIDLELGLQCLRLMAQHEAMNKDERQRLVNRVNVLLRAHPPMQLNLQVKE